MPGQRKLGMPTDQRRAMLRNQVTSFLENGKMTTTLTRAKETRSMAEKMITLGKYSCSTSSGFGIYHKGGRGNKAVQRNRSEVC